jgi:predicted permease
MREWLARIIDWIQRDKLDAELEEELRFHRAQLERDARASGTAVDDAERHATKRLGNTTRVREAARDRWSIPWLDHLQLDVRYAIRGLRRSPGLTASVVLTLGLGIGANAAIFSTIDRLLFRAPSLLKAPSLTNRVYEMYPMPSGEGEITLDAMTYARYLDFAKWTTSFDRTAIHSGGLLAVGVGENAASLPVSAVSASFFAFFDAPPAIGRYFTLTEDQPPNGEAVAVLGYSTWQTRYGGRRDVLGKTIQIGPTVYTVIGVAPSAFVGLWPEQPPFAYVPFAAFAGSSEARSRAPWWGDQAPNLASMLVQRKPSVTVAAASSDLTAALLRTWTLPFPTKPRVVASSILPERGPNQTSAAKVAALVGGMALIVLLIASANVANLLLARSLRRRREIAVRLAIGVTRGRLLSQLLTESLVLSLLGGAVGLVIAQWGGSALRLTLVPDAAESPVMSDLRTLWWVGVAVVVVAICTSLAPAWLAGRVDLTRHLKVGARDGMVQRSWLRIGLLVMQAALSALLLVGAGLFVQSLRNVKTLKLGYDVDPVLIADFVMRGTRLDSTRAAALREQLLETARRIPSIERAATALNVPMSAWSASQIRVPGFDEKVFQRLPDIHMNAVTPEYFATMGIRIARGRAIAATDVARAPGAVVVTSKLAKTLWPGKDPLGQCVTFEGDGGACSYVVGIIEDAKHTSITNDNGLFYYRSALQFAEKRRPLMTLVVRTRGPASEQADALRRALQKDMPGASYVVVRPFAEDIAYETRSWQLGATMFVIFGVLALTLAAVGLYGVISYDVTQRTHETGVRIALGAGTWDVIRLVMRQGVGVGATGVVIGVAVAAIAAGRIAPMLFDTSPWDARIYVEVAVAMLAVAAFATFIPARRAANTQPITALKTD